MDNEISLLMMVIVLLMIIRCYIAMASVSVTINIILWFVCCIAMFSVMIMSSIIGSTTLAFISAIVLAFSLGLFVTSAVMLRFCADANDKLKDLSRIVYNKLCNKILKHWQILIVIRGFCDDVDCSPFTQIWMSSFGCATLCWWTINKFIAPPRHVPLLSGARSNGKVMAKPRISNG